MRWKVISDFDKTISLVDTSDALLRKFALGWEEVEQRWESGEISSLKCMSEQVGLMHVSKSELDRTIDSFKIDENFVGFATYCKQNTIPLVIASDGMDYVIKRILSNHHLDHLDVDANQLEFLDNDRYALSAPHSRTHCADANDVCKCSVAKNSRNSFVPYRLFYIGDGKSDFCISGKIDLLMAKDSLLVHANENKLVHESYRDFSQVRAKLDRLHHGLELPGSFSNRHTAKVVSGDLYFSR